MNSAVTCHLHPPDLFEDLVAHQGHPHKGSKNEELDKWIYDFLSREIDENFSLNFLKR